MDIATMLRSDNFDIEVVDLESLPSMKRDLEKRLTRGSHPWEVAFVRAAEDAHGPHRTTSGMVLLHAQPNSNRFKGLYYKNADCGAYRDNVRTTAEMLSMVAVGTSAEQLYDGFLAIYPKVIVTGLNTETPIFLPA